MLPMLAAGNDAADEETVPAHAVAGSPAVAYPVPHLPLFSPVRETTLERQLETEWVVPNPVSPGTDWRPWPSVLAPRPPTPRTASDVRALVDSDRGEDKIAGGFKCRRSPCQSNILGADDHHWEEVIYEIQITIDKFNKKEHGCIRMAPSDMTGVPKQNVGSMYQRQVDTAFQSQLGRNLESYVDDIVIKSKTKQEMMMDITKTFDYLRQINMKLNPKKCLLRVEEGKFLGYMVTSEGIRENIKRTKAVLYMQSSRTPKEMQSLSGAYDIMYAPQNAVKGQVLEDFLNEIPIDIEKIEKRNLSNGKVAPEE
ncbi:reverse transcriptase domain-containing protein [Tanacetum coccineum]